MAENNTNFNLSFKYGEFKNLPAVSNDTNGTIYVTTDDKTMYVDLNGQRIRLGDVSIHKDLADLTGDKANWYTGALTYVEEGNHLAYFNGTSWININDTSSLSSAIDDVKSNLTNLTTRVGNNETAITNINNEIGQKSENNKATSIWDAIESLSGGSNESLNSLAEAIATETKSREDAIAAEAKARGEAIAAESNARAAAIEGVQSEITDLETSISKTYETKTDAENKLQTAKNYADGLKTALEGTTNDSKDSKTIEGAKKYAENIVNALQQSLTAVDNDLKERLEEVETFWEAAIRDGEEQNVIDTLKEIQDWIGSDTSGASAMLGDISQLKAILDGIGAEGDSAKTVVEYVSAAFENAKKYADSLASNYDSAGSASAAASAAEQAAKDYADGLASNYDAAGSAAEALEAAKDYANGLASNYDAAGSAAEALEDAKDYADGLASNYDSAGSAEAAAATALEAAKNYTDSKALTWSQF